MPCDTIKSIDSLIENTIHNASNETQTALKQLQAIYEAKISLVRLFVLECDQSHRENGDIEGADAIFNAFEYMNQEAGY